MQDAERLGVATTSKGFLIGVDVGATKIAVGLGRSDGMITRQMAVATPRENPELLADKICEVVTTLTEGHSTTDRTFRAIGVGICGQVDPLSGRVRSPIALGWPEPVEFGNMLRIRTGLDVFVDNDVNAAALGEMLWGAARGIANFVYLAVGTGIGLGIVVNGQLVRGAHNAAGEVGHMVIDLHGPLCSCGNRGCLEALAGGRDVASRVHEQVLSSPEGQASVLRQLARHGEAITTREIFRAAAEGDALSMSAVQMVGEYLAVAVVNLTNLLDPEKVIVGGGLTGTAGLLVSSLQEGLRKWRFLFIDSPSTLCLSAMGQDAGIAGALGVALASADPQRRGLVSRDMQLDQERQHPWEEEKEL